MNEMSTPQPSGCEASDDDPVDPLALMRRILVEQAVSLNGMFADLADFAVEALARANRATRHTPDAAEK